MRQTWTGALHNQSSHSFLQRLSSSLSQMDSPRTTRVCPRRLGKYPTRGRDQQQAWKEEAGSAGVYMMFFRQFGKARSILSFSTRPAFPPPFLLFFWAGPSPSMAIDRYLVLRRLSSPRTLLYVEVITFPHGRPWHRPCPSRLCFSQSLPRCVYCSLRTTILRSFFLSELLARSFQLQL